MHDKFLEVRLYGRRAGFLQRGDRNGFSFQYDCNYASDPGMPPLGIRFPLREKAFSPRLTQRWFEGLLPEGDRRTEFANALGVSRVDVWSLLHEAGAECAGAVQVVPPDHGDDPRLFELDDETLSALLEPATPPLSPATRAARLSLAGAQDKLTLHRKTDGTWWIPMDGHVSTHILKPSHPEFPGLVENEHWCMEVARRSGIEAASTAIENIDGLPVLIVERYDRIHQPEGTLERVHQEDLAQALGSRTKYQEDGYPSTPDLFRVPGVDRDAMLDRIFANWLLGNCDAHAKNYSVLEPGTTRARLAPAYDVVATEAYPHLSRRLATSIGRATTLDTVDASAVEALGRRLGFERGEPLRRLGELADRLDQAIGEVGGPPFGSDSMPRGTAQRIARSRTWRNARHRVQGEPTLPTRKPRLASGAKKLGAGPVKGDIRQIFREHDTRVPSIVMASEQRVVFGLATEDGEVTPLFVVTPGAEDAFADWMQQHEDLWGQPLGHGGDGPAGIAATVASYREECLEKTQGRNAEEGPAAAASRRA